MLNFFKKFSKGASLPLAHWSSDLFSSVGSGEAAHLEEEGDSVDSVRGRSDDEGCSELPPSYRSDDEGGSKLLTAGRAARQRRLGTDDDDDVRDGDCEGGEIANLKSYFRSHWVCGGASGAGSTLLAYSGSSETNSQIITRDSQPLSSPPTSRGADADSAMNDDAMSSQSQAQASGRASSTTSKANSPLELLGCDPPPAPAPKLSVAAKARFEVSRSEKFQASPSVVIVLFAR